MREVLCSMMVAAAALCLCLAPVLAWGPMRMTGGGSIFVGDVRVTHGFELHCPPLNSAGNSIGLPARGPNNLEINYITATGEHHWHLDTVTSAACYSDLRSPAPPPNTAGLDDIYNGCGDGMFDNTSTLHVCWYFTDHGEPGRDDTARYLFLPGLPSDTGDIKLTFGNHQVHQEN